MCNENEHILIFTRFLFTRLVHSTIRTRVIIENSTQLQRFSSFLNPSTRYTFRKFSRTTWTPYNIYIYIFFLFIIISILCYMRIACTESVILRVPQVEKLCSAVFTTVDCSDYVDQTLFSTLSPHGACDNQYLSECWWSKKKNEFIARKKKHKQRPIHYYLFMT
jgi:hypothetical protein